MYQIVTGVTSNHAIDISSSLKLHNTLLRDGGTHLHLVMPPPPPPAAAAIPYAGPAIERRRYLVTSNTIPSCPPPAHRMIPTHNIHSHTLMGWSLTSDIFTIDAIY